MLQLSLKVYHKNVAITELNFMQGHKKSAARGTATDLLLYVESIA